MYLYWRYLVRYRYGGIYYGSASRGARAARAARAVVRRGVVIISAAGGATRVLQVPFALLLPIKFSASVAHTLVATATTNKREQIAGFHCRG